MNALALEIIEAVAELMDAGTPGSLVAVDCYDSDGSLLGTHYSPLRLALALLDGDHIVDMHSEEAGSTVPVHLNGVTKVRVRRI